MSNNNGMNHIDDFMIDGFHKLDEKIVDERPPKIRWSDRFRERSIEDQAAYLEKLAHTMNHAAYLIQNERDQLNELCEKKELQLESLNEAIKQNNLMLQQEVARMNAQRQEYHLNIKRLNAEIRSLKMKVEELAGGDIG